MYSVQCVQCALFRVQCTMYRSVGGPVAAPVCRPLSSACTPVTKSLYVAGSNWLNCKHINVQLYNASVVS